MEGSDKGELGKGGEAVEAQVSVNRYFSINQPHRMTDWQID